MAEQFNDNNTPKQVANKLDGVQSDRDVVDSINYLGAATFGMERDEMLAFVREVSGIERKSKGVDVGIDKDGESLIFDFPPQFKVPEIAMIAEDGSYTRAVPVSVEAPSLAHLQELSQKDWTSWLARERCSDPGKMQNLEEFTKARLAFDRHELEKLSTQDLHFIGNIVESLKNNNHAGAIEALRSGFAGENFDTGKRRGLENAVNLMLREQKIDWMLSIGESPEKLDATLFRSLKPGQPYIKHSTELSR